MHTLFGYKGSGSAAIECALELADLLAAVVSKWAGTRQHFLEANRPFSDFLLRVDSHERVQPVFARHSGG